MKVTLCTAIVYKNEIIVFTDVIMSGPSRWNDPNPIPSVGGIKDIEDGIHSNHDFVFTDNVSKIHMFSPSILMCFAGNPSIVESCINEVQRLKDLSNLKKIGKIWANCQSRGKFEAIYIFKKYNQVSKKNDYILMPTNDTHENFNNFDRICAIGSGSDFFLEKMHKIDDEFDKIMTYHKEISTMVHSSINSYEQKLHQKVILSLQIVSMLFKEDFNRKSASLQRKFGGFYEIVVDYYDVFRKLVDYSICIWSYQEPNFHLFSIFQIVCEEDTWSIKRMKIDGTSYKLDNFNLTSLQNYYQNSKESKSIKDLRYKYPVSLHIFYTIKDKVNDPLVRFLIAPKIEDIVTLNLNQTTEIGGEVIEIILTENFAQNITKTFQIKKLIEND